LTFDLSIFAPDIQVLDYSLLLRHGPLLQLLQLEDPLPQLEVLLLQLEDLLLQL
jgi:hypothetical protein